MKKLWILAMCAALLCSCGNLSRAEFRGNIFAENEAVYDAVMGVYPTQEYIDRVYAAPAVRLLDDTSLNRSRILYAEGSHLYMVRNSIEGFVVGSYGITQHLFQPIFDSADCILTDFDPSGYGVHSIDGYVKERYLYFTLTTSEEDEYGVLCMFDTAQRQFFVVHRQVLPGEIVLQDKTYFVAVQDEQQALVQFDPIKKQTEVIKSGCSHITEANGHLLYAKADPDSDSGYAYYYADGPRYSGAENMGGMYVEIDGVAVSDVTLSAEEFREALYSFPFKYQSLRQSSAALALAKDGKTQPLLLPAGDCVLKNAFTDGRFVALDMQGDFLPRYYDVQKGQMVIVGQLSGHGFEYETMLTQEYIIIVTRASLSDARGNVTEKQQVYAVSRASLA